MDDVCVCMCLCDLLFKIFFTFTVTFLRLEVQLIDVFPSPETLPDLFIGLKWTWMSS